MSVFEWKLLSSGKKSFKKGFFKSTNKFYWKFIIGFKKWILYRLDIIVKILNNLNLIIFLSLKLNFFYNKITHFIKYI